MENSRKGKISEEQHVDPRVGVQEDVQEAARSQKPVEGVATGGRNTDDHEQNDVIDQLFLRLDMRGVLPQVARSPKSRSIKVGTGGRGTALRYRVAGSRPAASIRKRTRKTVSRKRITTKSDFLRT
ncbi:MAG: hypothetical protein ABSC48_19410 [Terracidiphilus sp.]|jgi:hypothetical protein